MAANWANVALAVILILIVFIALLSAQVQVAGAAGSSGAGTACNVYCVIKDLALGAGPPLCGC